MGLAFDGEGYLYVANMGDNTVEKFSPSGDQVATFSGPGLNSPAFIALQVPEPSTFALVAFISPVFMLYRIKIFGRGESAGSNQ